MTSFQLGPFIEVTFLVVYDRGPELPGHERWGDAKERIYVNGVTRGDVALRIAEKTLLAEFEDNGHKYLAETLTYHPIVRHFLTRLRFVKTIKRRALIVAVTDQEEEENASPDYPHQPITNDRL